MDLLFTIIVTFFAGMGAGLGTGFAGMSAALFSLHDFPASGTTPRCTSAICINFIITCLFNLKGRVLLHSPAFGVLPFAGA